LLILDKSGSVKGRQKHFLSLDKKGQTLNEDWQETQKTVFMQSCPLLLLGWERSSLITFFLTSVR